MQFKALLPLCLLLLALNTVSSQSNLFPIQSKKIFIEGSVSDYSDFKPKTGKISLFDTVSGLKGKKEFNIDTNGRFRFEINGLHAIYGNAYFDFEKRFFPLFLNPGESYKVEINIKDHSIRFLDETGKLSEEVARIEQVIYDNFKSEISRLTYLHKEDLSNESALEVYKNLEQKVIAFLMDYSNDNKVSTEALTILRNEHKYRTAIGWIALRYEYKDNKRRLRKNLPNDFFIQLQNDYPVNVTDAYVSSKYSQYIRDIGSVLSKAKEPNLDKKIDFFRSYNLFSEKELLLIKTVYSGNKDITKTSEYEVFFNDENATKIEKLNKKFDVNNLFIAVRQFPKGIGRDLIISQFVSRKYFRNTFINPSKEEWKEMEDLIENKIVLEELERIAMVRSKATQGLLSTGASPAYNETPTIESIAKKYLEPHKGKVIYIDFWATWCGPCRSEEPHARKLHKEFKKDDVVFLNLCCQSKKQIWSTYIKEKDLDGEHYLLSNAEFKLFAEMYNLKGFPSYILIDKTGNVKSMDAYWPSDSKRVIRQIDKLLR